MPQLQRLEVQPPAGAVGDHDLPVDHAAFRQLGQDRGHELGEVAGHRPLVPAADLHLVAVPEHDRPEAVPLRLEYVVPVGIASIGLASIGATGGLTGRSIAPLLHIVTAAQAGLLPAAHHDHAR